MGYLTELSELHQQATPAHSFPTASTAPLQDVCQCATVGPDVPSRHQASPRLLAAFVPFALNRLDPGLIASFVDIYAQ